MLEKFRKKKIILPNDENKKKLKFCAKFCKSVGKVSNKMNWIHWMNSLFRSFKVKSPYLEMKMSSPKVKR